MRTIKTQKDLVCLRNAQLFSGTFMDYLDEEFQALKEAFDFDGLDEDFRLEVSGFLVVFEKGDNLRDQSVVGLYQETNGLLGCLPEFIEMHVHEGEVWYKVVTVISNDFGYIYYIQRKVVEKDDEILVWLEENSEYRVIVEASN